MERAKVEEELKTALAMHPLEKAYTVLYTAPSQPPQALLASLLAYIANKRESTLHAYTATVDGKFIVIAQCISRMTKKIPDELMTTFCAHPIKFGGRLTSRMVETVCERVYPPEDAGSATPPCCMTAVAELRMELELLQGALSGKEEALAAERRRCDDLRAKVVAAEARASLLALELRQLREKSMREIFLLRQAAGSQPRMLATPRATPRVDSPLHPPRRIYGLPPALPPGFIEPMELPVPRRGQASTATSPLPPGFFEPIDLSVTRMGEVRS
jgi:hypothetical protein